MARRAHAAAAAPLAFPPLRFERLARLPFEEACSRVGIILDHRRCAVDLDSPVTTEVAVWRLLCAVARDCARALRAARRALRSLQTLRS